MSKHPLFNLGQFSGKIAEMATGYQVCGNASASGFNCESVASRVLRLPVMWLNSNARPPEQHSNGRWLSIFEELAKAQAVKTPSLPIPESGQKKVEWQRIDFYVKNRFVCFFPDVNGKIAHQTQ